MIAENRKQHGDQAGLLQQAMQKQVAGDWKEAQRLLEKILKRKPGSLDALSALGANLLSQKRYDKAITHLKRVSARVEDADTLYNLGLCYYHKHEYQPAAEYYLRAIDCDANHGRAYYMLGRNYLEWNRGQYQQQALAAFAKDIELNERVDACHLASEILINTGKPDQARDLIKRVLKVRPNDELALYNLAKSLIGEHYSASVVDIRVAEPIVKIGSILVELYPQSWRGHHILSEALAMVGENELAIKHFEEVNRLVPDFHLSRTNMGLLLLKQGRFSEGWNEVASRSRHAADFYGMDTANLQHCPAPLWQGQIEPGLHLLVVSEQGIGDQLLHIQLVCELLEKGMQVSMTCTPKIRPMLERSLPGVHFYDEKVLLSETVLAGVDYKAELMDLGRFLRLKPTDFERNYRFLKPDPELVEYYRARYQAMFPGKYLVGISWKSHSRSSGTLKSTTLMDWLPILQQPNCQFINVQYGETEQEISAFTASTGIAIFTEDFNPFHDVERALAQLAAIDQLISVSNASVHMAGQLGLPTWVLLHYRSLWHWFENTDTSCWYDFMRLFRQDQMSDWKPVIAQVAQQLQSVIEQKS